MFLGQEKRKAVNEAVEEEELVSVAPVPVMAAPQEKPAWMDAHAQSTARATMLLMEDRFQKIESNQQAAAQQQSTLSLAVNRQGQEQARMQTVLDEVVRKQSLFDGCGSVGTGSASSGGSTRAPNLLEGFANLPDARVNGNPYGAGAALVDKSLVIVGGWRENSPREVLVNDMNRFIIAYNLSGHTSVLAEVRCPARAKFASVTFAESSADGTAVAQAWKFTGWMRSLSTAAKPQCTGGAGAWSVINQSVDDRRRSKCIKRGLRALHLLREDAGVAAVVTELGVEVPYVEGRFKGQRPGVFLGGKRVADYDETKDLLQWNYKELKESSLAIEEAALESKMSEMVGVPS